jgi:hypothetical protein
MDPEARQCTRCEKMNLSCVFVAPSSRQRRKRVDARVAELEKELKAMKKLLEKTTISDSTSRAIPTTHDSTDIRASWEQDNSPQDRLQALISTSPDRDGSPASSTSSQLFHKFITDMLPHFPLVHFPPSITAEEVNQSQPTMYLAIVAAAAAGCDSQLGRQFAAKLEKVYTDKVFVKSEKSLELVQSLLIGAIWYHPPDRFEDLKFTQFAHMAANMALDIQNGMGISAQGRFDNGGQDSPKGLLPNDKWLENRRTIVACYVLCSGFVIH